MRNPFKREKNPTIAELENYYAGQRTAKRRSAPAWLMALMSLIITLAVILALYFGIRWAYRALTDDSANDVTISDTNGGSSDPEFGEVRVGGSDTSTDDDSEQSSENRVADALGGASSDSSEGTVSDEAVSTTRGEDTLAGSDSDSDETLVSAGANELPNTGAGESMIILFVALTAAGYFSARKFQS